jgi:hypothetical protein
MTLANCPAECEHCAPCLAEMHEAMEDTMDFVFDPNWRTANQPASNGTSEEIHGTT